MRGLRAHGMGRIIESAEVITNESDNRFVQFVVEFEERLLRSGKEYAQRVTFRSFDPLDINKADKLTAGRWVFFDGDCDAVAEKGQTGWWYANPRVTGRIQQIIEPEREVTRG